MSERWLEYGDPGDSNRVPVEYDNKQGTIPVKNLGLDFVERAEHSPGQIFLSELTQEEESQLLEGFDPKEKKRVDR